MKVRLSFGAGWENVISDLNGLGDVGVQIAKRRFREFAPRIVARQKALAPVDVEDGGQLRDTIRHMAPRAGGKTFANVTFVVGGDALLPFLKGHKANVYAIVQETDPTLSHSHGQAGFMTQPLTEAAESVFAAIEKDVSAEAERVSG